MRKLEKGIFEVSKRVCFPQPPKNENFGEPTLAQRVYICSTRRMSTRAERALSVSVQAPRLDLLKLRLADMPKVCYRL